MRAGSTRKPRRSTSCGEAADRVRETQPTRDSGSPGSDVTAATRSRRSSRSTRTAGTKNAPLAVHVSSAPVSSTEMLTKVPQ